MPRPLGVPDRSIFQPDAQEQYDAATTRIGTKHSDGEVVSDIWSLLLWSPAYALNRLALTPMIATAGDHADTSADYEREFAHQVLAVALRSDIVVPWHLKPTDPRHPGALAAGVRLEAIEALRAGRDDDLTQDERLLAQFIRQVTDGTVLDSTWNHVEARMGTRATVEYVIFITVVAATIRQMSALGLPEPATAETDRLIAELKNHGS